MPPKSDQKEFKNRCGENTSANRRKSTGPKATRTSQINDHTLFLRTTRHLPRYRWVMQWVVSLRPCKRDTRQFIKPQRVKAKTAWLKGITNPWARGGWVGENESAADRMEFGQHKQRQPKLTADKHFPNTRKQRRCDE